MKKEFIKKVEEIIGYPKDKWQWQLYGENRIMAWELLISRAFTRQSYTVDNPSYQSQEVLETIGDSVVNLVVTKAIVAKYQEYVVSEGLISELRKAIVSGENLAKRCKKINLVQKGFLNVGKSEIENKLLTTNKVFEDTLEAVIGAVALDCQFNINVLSDVVLNILDIEHLEAPAAINDYFNIIQKYQKCSEDTTNNPINILQELFRGKKIPSIEYLDKGQSQEGWVFYSLIAEWGLIFYGIGSTKKEAKMSAADKMYKEVNKKLDSKDAGWGKTYVYSR